jgi:hypothetical protein
MIVCMRSRALLSVPTPFRHVLAVQYEAVQYEV